MRKYAWLLLPVVILASCKSSPVITNVNIPDREIGCSDKTGWDRQDCLNKQSERWEQVENSTPSRKQKSSERLTWTHVRNTYEVCRFDLCHKEILVEEDPVWYWYVAHYGGIIGGTLVVVFVAGMSQGR